MNTLQMNLATSSQSMSSRDDVDRNQEEGQGRMKISEFRGAYAPLSNFWEAPVTYKGLTYGSNEAAFQAQKCANEAERIEFTQLNPSASKKKGRHVHLRPDWEQVKVGIMEEIVREKFIQNDNLKGVLLSTGDAFLEEGNTWHDTFWGVDARTGEGENHLGQILMQVRAELRSKEML